MFLGVKCDEEQSVPGSKMCWGAKCAKEQSVMRCKCVEKQSKLGYKVFKGAKLSGEQSVCQSCNFTSGKETWRRISRRYEFLFSSFLMDIAVWFPVWGRSPTTLTRFWLFDHLPPCIDIFYGMNVVKKGTFWDHLPTSPCIPYTGLVTVVCERPVREWKNSEIKCDNYVPQW